jgi:serpin B
MNKLLSLLFVLLLVACGGTAPQGQVVQADVPRIESPDVSDAQVAQLVAGNQAFAFDLYHAVAAGEGGNLIYSPYSISLAFSMVYVGARGEVEAEMAQVLHLMSQETQHPALNAVDQRLRSLGEARQSEQEGAPFQLNLANAVWGQQGYAFQEPFLETLAAQYGAGLRAVDFQEAAEKAREAINAWVTEETRGRINEIAPPGSVSPVTRLVLANAIYFKAGWAYRFQESDTADGPFTLLDGRRVTVPLMHQKMRLEYMAGEGYQAVQLPYVGRAVDMWVILPAEGRFEEVQERLGVDLLEEVRQEAGAWQVILTLPRFGFGTDLQLHELLPGMGMPDAFCPAMDFDGMVEGGGLCIGCALHRATITVDEEGTEAAAATIAEVLVSEVQDVEMAVDRPFLFAIIERETGVLLFLGRVLNPAVR